MTFGLTPAGFNSMRLADIKQALENAFIAQFGDINLDPQSVFGQEIGVISKSLADIWENLEDVYFSQYPNSASGVSLDNVVGLNGLTRLPATQTSVVASCQGLEGTFIPQNALASISENGTIFQALTGGFITQTNADLIDIEVNAVAAQPYTVILSNQVFTYSIPTITFSNSGAIFVTGNNIIVTINGVQLPSVPFTTDSNTTLALIATAISNFGSGSELVATATPTNIITIVPNLGFSASVQMPIQITGGASQATSALTFQAPSNDNAITSNLAELINSGDQSWIATDNMDGTLTVLASSPSVPFNSAVNNNLTIITRSSPINFVSQDFGPIPCPVAALDTILTPIAGWQSITNYIAGVTGTLTETDAMLRLRRQNSIRLFTDATVPAITAGLQQDVPGVTSAIVFENVTLTQESIVIVFPEPFNSSDVITVQYDLVSFFSVDYDTSQSQTMTDLVNAFELIPSVSSATFGGTGNQTLTVNMVIAQVLTVNLVTTNVSDQNASISGGLPPKSFEAVVEGGENYAVANQIWETKPAGIETYGSTEQAIIDSQGNTQVIFFSRPTQIFIWVQVALTLYPEETFPVGGIQAVQQAIFNYGSKLGVGVDVLFQRVLAQIFAVPGIASGSMTIASTFLETDNPSYGTSDIPIANNQISTWNLDNIYVTVA